MNILFSVISAFYEKITGTHDAIPSERQVFSLNINSQQLRFFMEVAKCLNFTRAAANLYVAQPTLSQQIADLETQLGISLFVRSSRSVTLTPAGAILYDAYPNIVAHMQQLHQQMLVTAAGFSGNLTIGFLDIFTDMIPMIIRDFKRSFPDIAIKPVCASQNELHSRLKDNAIDMAFTILHGFPPEEQASFSARAILHDTPCFVLPPEHPVPADYSFAESMPLIVLDTANDACHRPLVCKQLEKLGIHVPQVISTDSMGNLRVYLESGAGFSVLPEKSSALFSDGTRFIPLPGEHLELGLLWNTNSSNPSLPLFLDALDQFLNPASDADTVS